MRKVCDTVYELSSGVFKALNKINVRILQKLESKTGAFA